MGSSNNKVIGKRESLTVGVNEKDQDSVKALQDGFPQYAEKIAQFSLHSSGMNQYVAWTALEAEGFGANLQVRESMLTTYSLL